MKNWFKDENVKKNIFTYSITGIIVVFVYLLLSHIPALARYVKGFLTIIAPFLWGALFALIMHPVAKRFEELFKKHQKFKPKTRRTLSAFLSVLIFLLVVILIFVIIIPQLVTSITSLSKTINNYSSNFSDFNAFLSNTLHLSNDAIKIINDYSSTIIQSVLTFINNAIPNIITVLSSAVGLVVNFFMGVVIAIYLLIDRERIYTSVSKFFKVLLPEKYYNDGQKIFSFSIQKFGQFFSGKIIDSLIICILCFILMNIFRLNYSVLISVVVGVTNIVPFFGPFIGAIPSALILLIDNPTSALIFLVLILVLQQIDGNIIGPRILGDSVGLSSLWIMFALIVGGGYFGFAGMLLGVPIFAIIYYIFDYYVGNRLDNLEENKNTKE